MSTDPRTSIKALLAAEIIDANLTRDDDTTLLSWISVFGPYETYLPRIFFRKSFDLIFVINDAVTVKTTLGVSHAGEYPVTPYAIDKYDSSGTPIITATLALHKATKELRRVFHENPWGSLRSLKEDHVAVHDFGGTKVWSKPCTIEYQTYSE